MRVIAPAEPARIRPQTRMPRAMRVETAGLLVSSIVVLAGLVLAYSAKIGRLDEIEAGATVIALHALAGPADVEPVLTMFTSGFERQAVARAIYRRATSRPPLEHVGGLAAASIPARTIRADRRFVQLRTRLEQTPGAPDVLVFSRADIAAVKPHVTVRSSAQFTRRAGRAAAAFFGAFWLAHALRRWRRRNDDPVLLPGVLLLCGIGATAMLALRDPLRDTMSLEVFCGGAAAGVLVLVLASEVDFEASRLRRHVMAPLAVALALAATLLLFGSGPGASDVKVNLFGVQPVEAIRLLVIFTLAAYFGRRMELLRELSEPPTSERPWLRYIRTPRWRDVRPIFTGMALVLAFFFLQKDLGPALVLTCVFLALYGVARGHGAFVAVGFAMLLAAFAGAYWIGFPATVRERVMIWSQPWSNGVPGGNQVAHAFWALSTGAAWGSGPGLGSPQAIPAGSTDFVLAVVGEELGFIGLAASMALYLLLCWRCLRIAVRAPGDYSAFLGAGMALALVVQTLVIASGLLALVPLSGVVTPFLSYGRSSMLANCFAIGVVLSVANRPSAVREHLRQPVRILGSVLALAGVVVLSRVAWIQIVHAGDVAAQSSLTLQADGGYRFEHNPRLLSAARTIVRGTIYDRNGVPLATSKAEEIGALDAIYGAAGLAALEPCQAAERRCYPLGGLAFHVIGDWTRQTNWGARNSSYLERDSDNHLRGYDDRAATVEVVHPKTGRRELSMTRDLRALLPLVRERYRPQSKAVQALLGRNRDLHTSLDARLQMRAAAALRDRIELGGHSRGALVVLDAATGELLASVSYPWPASPKLASLPVASEGGPASPEETPEAADRPARMLDRSRYGLYPPGSAFKLLVAGAALRTNADAHTFECVRLPDGRVGNYIRGSSRPVRDDLMDTVAHGKVDLERGLNVSCNAYFAQLALQLGPGPLLDAASVFQIDLSRPQTPDGLRPTLPHAGYGQGEVLVSPLKLARVSAAIASGGVATPVRWVGGESSPTTQPFLSAPDALRLARAMRDVVLSGTGRSLRSHPVAIAGKTGTAEVDHAAAHSWFTGFAPYGGDGRRIAFAVIVENAGYGARAAAPIAGDIVSAASEFGLIR